MAGSRGKGSRRRPGRSGGARKRKPIEWHKQATHAVDDARELGEPVVSLRYWGEWGQPPSVQIYKFDQKIAAIGIRYHARCLGRRAGFEIQVLDEHAPKVRSLIAEL